MGKFFVRVDKIDQPYITGLIEFPDEQVSIRWVVNSATGQVESMQGEGADWEQKRPIASVEIQNQLARLSRD